MRDPFPGNIIPLDRIDPMARRFVEHFLRPNQAAPAGSDPWRNNFLFAPNLAYDDFHNIATKVDQTNPLMTQIDRIVQRSPYESDRRHRITLSGVYHLPFGRDKAFMNNANAVVDALLGGWEVAGMWLFNSGRPWGLPQNVIYVKDATIRDVDFNAPVIRGVQHCVAQMNNAGVVTMLAYSVAAGCTEPTVMVLGLADAAPISVDAVDVHPGVVEWLNDARTSSRPVTMVLATALSDRAPTKIGSDFRPYFAS